MLLLMLMMLRYRLELLDHPYLAQVNIVLRPLQEPGTACCSMVQPGEGGGGGLASLYQDTRFHSSMHLDGRLETF